VYNLIEHLTSQGSTALKHAARNGHTACVEALIVARASLDIKDVSYARFIACLFALIHIKLIL
jgi:ankyrin repeat protein